MALAARAARPLPEIKAEWLTTILDTPDSYKLATLRTIVSVLFPAEQMALLEPQRERILAAIPAMNTNASQEFLDSIAGGLAPATCTQASVDRLAQANTDFAGMLPLVVKAYLVHHQNDATCVSMKALAQ
jgi:aminopeptidase N